MVSSMLRRGVSLKKVNAARRAKRHAVAFGPKAEWIRSLPCATCGAVAPSDPSHVRSRAAGGSADDLIPQCRRCHSDLHSLGRRTFESRYGVDLHALAERYCCLYKDFSTP